MRARTAVAAGLAGYVVGRFVGQARAWLDVLADLPDLPTDDDPVLDLPWLCADDPTVPAQRTPPEACTEFKVPGLDVRFIER